MSAPNAARISRYRLRINREGFFLYLLLFAIGLAAYNTGNNLLFLFVSVMATLSVTHALVNYATRQHHTVERRLPPTLFAGQPFPVTLRLSNRKRFFSSFSIILRDEKAGGGETGRAHFVVVPAKSSAERRYEMTAVRRGLFRFDGVWLDCRYPFGLTLNAMRYELPQQCVVFPRLIPVQSFTEQRAGRYGDLERHEKGVGSNLYGLREYQEGESSRHIHWRTSAKCDTLMVKEFEDEERRHVTLLFENTGDPAADYDETFEETVSQTASLADHFIARGWQVELITLSGTLPHGSGPGHLRNILYFLALIQPVALSAHETHERLLRHLNPDAGHIVWIHRRGNINPELYSEAPSLQGGSAR